jgi:CheY-like chemotaxis protein
MRSVARTPDVLPFETVLVVDADPDTRELYSVMLTDIAQHVEHADDGRIALAKAVALRPALVITEARVPHIDGYTLCQLLRADPATAKVSIVLVSSDTRAAQRERIPRGANALLVKPFTTTEFINTIRSVVDASSPTSSELSSAAVRSPVEVIANASQARPRAKNRSHQRYVTTAPPAAPPTLRCPQCDRWLTYVHSQIGGVSATSPEQWDLFECPAQCGSFEYRHRTRAVRLLTGVG